MPRTRCLLTLDRLTASGPLPSSSPSRLVRECNVVGFFMDPSWLDSLQKNLVVCALQRLDRLPRHVGIIMDGNRRFARHRGTDRHTGHTSGFETMSRVLATAYSAGISEVSVYAFSIENFSRSKEEVADLMDIARTRLIELVAHSGIAQEYGVRIRVVGDLSLLPQDVKELAERISTETAANRRATLNLCMPYTSRDDMAFAIRNAAQTGAKVSVEDISKNLRTAGSLPLDLLIRTSATQRLSDFLLWEITEHTYIDFVRVLWPEYTPWQLLLSVLKWWNRCPR